MAGWSGWVAAIGGAVSLIGNYVSSISGWAVPLGALVAVIFGIWAAYQ